MISIGKFNGHVTFRTTMYSGAERHSTSLVEMLELGALVSRDRYYTRKTTHHTCLKHVLFHVGIQTVNLHFFMFQRIHDFSRAQCKLTYWAKTTVTSGSRLSVSSVSVKKEINLHLDSADLGHYKRYPICASLAIITQAITLDHIVGETGTFVTWGTL